MTNLLVNRMNWRETLKGSLFLFLAFFVLSCGSSGKKEAARFRRNLEASQLDQAKSMLADGIYYPGKNSELLRLVEYGTILHLEGNYYQSLLVFDKASELSNKLFTVSLSKKAGTFVLSEKVDNYYGEKYERSAIRFYQALNHLILAKTGFYEQYSAPVWPIRPKGNPETEGDVKVKEEKTVNKTNKKKVKLKAAAFKTIPAKKLSNKKKLRHLRAARASIVAWDSLLDSYQAISGGKDLYKEDMTAKVFGAWVHRSQKTRGDTNIAKGLYKEGQKLLFRNYNTYQTYNSKHKKFRDDFKKLPKMGRAKVEKEYVSASLFSDQLKNLLKEEERTLKSKKKSNSFFLINEGFIASKTAKKYSFPIGFNTLPLGVGVGSKGDFISFVRKVLAISSVGGPAISFELPYIESFDFPKTSQLIIKDKAGKLVAKKDLAILNPMSDLAREALDQKNGWLKTKVGTRLVAKHLVALGTAYVAYRAAKKKQGELLAMLGATAMYALSNRAINSGETADLRFWSSLPGLVRGAHLKLKAGLYDAFIISSTAGPEVSLKTTSLGEVLIKKGAQNFIKKRIY
jgi:hypothetical protein